MRSGPGGGGGGDGEEEKKLGFFASIFSPRSSDNNNSNNKNNGAQGKRKSTHSGLSFDFSNDPSSKSGRGQYNGGIFDLDELRPQKYSKKVVSDAPQTKTDKIDERLAKEMLRPASFIALGGVALALVGVNKNQFSVERNSNGNSNSNSNDENFELLHPMHPYLGDVFNLIKNGLSVGETQSYHQHLNKQRKEDSLNHSKNKNNYNNFNYSSSSNNQNQLMGMNQVEGIGYR